MSSISAMTFMATTTSRHWLQMRARRSRARRGPPALSCNQRTRGHPTSNRCTTSTATKLVRDPESGHRFSEKITHKQKLERDDDSTKNHPALARVDGFRKVAS